MVARVPASCLFVVCALVVSAGPALAHEEGSSHSEHAVRFHGTGTGQLDRIRIPLDDDLPGPNASAACDIGAGSFTVEFWLRGELSDNATTNAGGDLSVFDDSWRAGNMLLDRDVASGTERHFGVSVAGGFVRFGTGAGDSGPDLEHTLEGDSLVLDGAWHHIACVRDAADGSVAIFVDGALDVQSGRNVSTADLSYPDAGVAGLDPWGPYLVIGAEKHDTGPAHPAFDGYFDELRIWNTARTASEIVLSYWRAVAPTAPGLVGHWELEEGAGTALADSSAAKCADGELVAGMVGNGEWTASEDGLLETAGIVHVPLPPGFVRTTISSSLGPTTCMTAAPDGRLFLGEHTGAILVVDATGALLPTPMITIALSQSVEAQGLLGLTLDPDFANNGFLYAYYTSPDVVPRNRVGRFTVVGDTADPLSEVVVWENDDAAGGEHLGGALCVGPDGHLYIATGDNQASELARDLSALHGKLLRVALDGSIPALNPFVAIPNARPEIWARGLRNPFRMTVDASSGAIVVGDVGGNKKAAEEEVNRVAVAADFGWPIQEGDHCFVAPCEHITHPDFSYAHNDPEYSDPNDPAGGTQGAVILGPVYDDSVFPREYQGNLFIGDYANQWIRRLERDAQGNVVASRRFLEDPEAGSVVDLALGSDGSLYYLTFPAGASTAGGNGTLYKLTYVAGGNQPPVALAGADVLAGPAPLTVQFDADASFDPDGGALSWAWDFGDTNGSSSSSPQHTYTLPGHYTVNLGVSDGTTTTPAESLTIDVGNAPVVTITGPDPNHKYRAAELILLTGGATDVEDGTLGPSALEWSVDLVHAGHLHPTSTGQGNTFRIPKKGHTPEDTHYRFTLTATDSDGLSSSSSVDLYPLDAPMVFDTYPAGIPMFIDGQAESTPRPYQSLPDFRHRVEAQEFFTLGAQTFRFAFWTNGKKRKHTYTVPDGGSWLRAVYVPTRDLTAQGTVAQAEHCAMYRPSTGQAFADASDPLEVTCGREATEVAQAGFEFDLQVPPDALIRSARLVVTAGSDHAGSPLATIWAFDVAQAPAFVDADPTPLTAWSALGDSYVSWDLPAFVSGVEYASPDLAPLLQDVVDRPGWAKGNRVGLVLDGTPAQVPGWRSFANFASGTPARLEVEYSTDKQGPFALGAMGGR